METNKPQQEQKEPGFESDPKFWICFVTLFFFPLGGIMALISLLRKKKNDACLYGWSCLIGFIICVTFLILIL